MNSKHDNLNTRVTFEDYTPAPATSPKPNSQFSLLSLTDLLSLPKPTWILEDILIAGGLAVLFGPSGTGKTFIALDWALSVAAGESWLGHQAKAGHVVYIAAEGVYGIGVRVQAWLDSHKLSTITNISFIAQPVQMLVEDEVETLINTIQQKHPVLVVIDTLARSLVGGDENSAKDMGLLIAACNRLQKRTRATVLLIHHTSKNSQTERGSSALRGAADTMLAVSESDNVLTLTCEKQKDAAPFDRLLLQLSQYGDSCLVTRWNPQRAHGLTANQIKVLEALENGFTREEGASSSTWFRVAEVSERTFHTAKTALLNRGLVRQDGSKRQARYFLTPEGEELLRCREAFK